MALQLHVSKLSGEKISVQVAPEKTVAELMKILELRLAAPVLALVACSGQLRQESRLQDALHDGAWTTVVHGREDRCYKQRHATALRRSDGSVVAFGRKGLGALSEPLEQVVQLVATRDAFAALRADGEVVTWGKEPETICSQCWALHATDHDFCAETSQGLVIWGTAPRQMRQHVQQVAATRGAFAALVEGTVLAWGEPQLGGSAPQLHGAVALCASDGAFAARLDDGRGCAWGGAAYGGEAPELREVLELHAARHGFTALREGSSITWGMGGPVRECHVPCGLQVVASNEAFAAILPNGSVLSWGAVEQCTDLELHEVRQLRATCSAFCALAAGRGVCWGLAAYGGDGEVEDVLVLEATLGAFAALRSDGSVATWGHPMHGGAKIELQEVMQLSASEVAFTAVKKNGQVLRWGHPHYTRCGVVGQIE